MRVGKSVWHSRRINDLNAEIGEYDKPTEIITRFNYFTVMPAVSRGFMEVIKSGETLYDTWTATANSRYFSDKHNFVFGENPLGRGYFHSNTNAGLIRPIKAGDLMWLDGDTPPLEDKLTELYGYKQSATAEVKYVTEVNYTMYIRLERNQDKELK